MLKLKKYRVLLALVLCFWTIRCGNAGKSADVHFSVAPGTPSVINTDYPITPTSTITAPWYAFVMNVTNDSDETVTILALSLHVTMITPQGETISADISLNPSAADFSIACGATATQQINYTDFGQFAPGESSPLKLDYRGILGTGCAPIPTQFPTLYAGGNPAPPPGSNSFVYTVQVTPQGWFGTLAAPTDRLTATYYFSTD